MRLGRPDEDGFCKEEVMRQAFTQGYSIALYIMYSSDSLQMCRFKRYYIMRPSRGRQGRQQDRSWLTHSVRREFYASGAKAQ